MINFEEELKKFHPSLEIEDAADAIYNQDLTDMADVLVGMLKEAKEEELKKFHPSLEIEDAADAIYNQDLTDMADVLVGMLKEAKEEE